MWSDNPVTVLGADWVTAVQARGGRGVRRVPADGGRAADPARVRLPAARRVGAARRAVHRGVRRRPGEARRSRCPRPDVDVVSAAIDQWTQIRKPSSVLEVIDISGSMDEAIGDGRSKLDGAIEGAQATLGHFRSTDEVGRLGLHDRASSRRRARTSSCCAMSSRSASDRESLGSSLDDLRFADRQGTPLYDAIAARLRRDDASAPSRGASTRSSCSRTARTPTRRSRSTRSSPRSARPSREGGDDAPVRIFPIAYGEGADTGRAAADRRGDRRPVVRRVRRREDRPRVRVRHQQLLTGGRPMLIALADAGGYVDDAVDGARRRRTSTCRPR